MLLAIETSCDDTCAAVLDGPRILSSLISSQAAAHEGFGGVVPEVAARHHLELAAPVVEAALREAGVTLDDAAGEAFDKSARLLGLGYPGGPAVQREAEGGDPEAFEMPVAMSRNPGLDFSFSGLKTAVLYRCRELGPEGVEERRADLAASFQAAVVEQLTTKLKRALKQGDWEAVALGGGVAANGPLREAVAELCEEMGVRLKLVPISLCTDNAAMIGSAARFAAPVAYPDYLGYDAFASGETAGQPH